jgi:4-hydroxybenzoate polyprenyltransferase
MIFKRLWSYVELTHPYAAGTIFVATVVFSLLASGSVPEPLLFVRVIGVVALGQACVGFTNELRDMPQDRLVKPYRPLVDGRANPTVATVIAWSAGIGSLLLGLTFGLVGVGFALLGTGAGLAYNFWLKGTMMSWVPYTISFSLLPLWPFAALDQWNPTLAWIWLLILPASIALNIAQSLGDIDDDRALGIGGLAERLGRQRALLLMWLTSALTIVLALLTAVPSSRPIPLYGAALVAAGLVGVAAWHCYRAPGPTAWKITWRSIAAAMGILGIGWFSAVL